MRLEDDTLGASVRALRTTTAASTDGAATRARVLGLVEQGRARRVLGRRLGVFVLALLASVTFGSAAWTAIGSWRTRTPTSAVPVRVATPAHADRAPSAPVTAAVEVPAAPALAGAPPTRGDTETRAYGRAHEAHFLRDAPAEALAAWNRYLAVYPGGAFAPDARYNRALCLLRLGRHAAASQALRPFADGAFHGYRRVEATALLDWLERQPP